MVEAFRGNNILSEQSDSQLCLLSLDKLVDRQTDRTPSERGSSEMASGQLEHEHELLGVARSEASPCRSISLGRRTVRPRNNPPVDRSGPTGCFPARPRPPRPAGQRPNLVVFRVCLSKRRSMPVSLSLYYCRRRRSSKGAAGHIDTTAPASGPKTISGSTFSAATFSLFTFQISDGQQ